MACALSQHRPEGSRNQVFLALDQIDAESAGAIPGSAVIAAKGDDMRATEGQT
jgi:hypothetical protein